MRQAPSNVPAAGTQWVELLPFVKAARVVTVEHNGDPFTVHWASEDGAFGSCPTDMWSYWFAPATSQTEPPKAR